ncbi:hypothetical protein O181_037407 [Austropuccinia psidii MF-1]|uniref:Uncharacterized protein n=1 Tax=Austropuccinia psidii MF-1 TaxID=1389203 RepID=A0A9Q3D8Y3_9BASI|nr:hypothetical protein [Austropuccinia psidii MF-1]
MRPKGKPTSPQGLVDLKPQLGRPEPFLASNPIKPKMAMKTLRTHFGQGSPWITFHPMASGNHQGSQDQLQNLFLTSRGIFPFLHASCTQGCRSGAYMVLYSIMHRFAQKSNGDILRTKFHDKELRSQSPTPISKEDSSAHHTGNPWQLSEDYSRTPTAWPCRSWVGNYSRIIPRAVLRVYSSLNQLSRKKVLQYSLDNSIGPYRSNQLYLYVLGPIGPIHIPLWEFNHTVQFSRCPELYWPNSDKTAGDSPSSISPSNFHIYWPPFITWGLFSSINQYIGFIFILIFFTLLK